MDSKNYNEFDAKSNAKQYYGEKLQNSQDLKTSSCCTMESIPKYILDVLPSIKDEIKDKYYGCGSVIPLGIEGLRGVDIGSGTGRDSFIMSKYVGENGFVYGIDMTENQINIARKYQQEQAEIFGYKKNNTTFIHDEMENIDNYFEPGSIDIVTSNCVINLAEDKKTVFSKIFKILKKGGELYFSDIYADRRLPVEIKNHPVLHGECLGGALYINDFIKIVKEIGFDDPRIMTQRIIDIDNDDLKNLVGNAKFYSITYRLWKLDNLDENCEDYGNIATYKGGIPYAEDSFYLDGEHLFQKNRPERICSNTARMIKNTRFHKYFEISGSFNEHFGQFKDCGTMAHRENEALKNNNTLQSCC